MSSAMAQRSPSAPPQRSYLPRPVARKQMTSPQPILRHAKSSRTLREKAKRAADASPEPARDRKVAPPLVTIPIPIVSPRPMRRHALLGTEEKRWDKDLRLSPAAPGIMDDVSNRTYCMRSPKPLMGLGMRSSKPKSRPTSPGRYLYAHQPVSDMDHLDIDAASNAKSHAMSRIKSAEAIGQAFRAAGGFVGLFRTTSPEPTRRSASTSRSAPIPIRAASPAPDHMPPLMAFLNTDPAETVFHPPRPMSPSAVPTTSLSNATSLPYKRKLTRKDSADLRKRLQDAASANYIVSERPIQEEGWVYLGADDPRMKPEDRDRDKDRGRGRDRDRDRDRYRNRDRDKDKDADSITMSTTSSISEVHSEVVDNGMLIKVFPSSPKPVDGFPSTLASCYESFPQIQEEGADAE